MELVKPQTSRKKQIEEKATLLFMNKGYVGSSMRDLAGVIGIEPASIYSHIKSKEEILHGICFRIAEKFMLSLNTILEHDNSPKQKFRDAILAHIKVITEDTSASAVFWNEWKHLSEPALSKFAAMKEAYEVKFIELIRQLVPGRSRYDAKIIAMTLLSSLNGIHQWYKREGEKTYQEIGDQIAEIYLTGMNHQLNHK